MLFDIFVQTDFDYTTKQQLFLHLTLVQTATVEIVVYDVTVWSRAN